MKAKVNLWILSLFTLFSCQYAQNDYQKTEHHQQGSDHTIYTMDGLEHGLIQSPVNILTGQTSDTVKHKITVIRPDTLKAADVVNTGHSVQLDLDPGAAVQFDGIEYHFLQGHFHTPSEHQVDGITYPMEMHFVSMANKNKESNDPHYLVVGVFFKMGTENKFIQAFIDKIPETEKDTALLNEKPVYINDLLEKGEAFNDYYYYKGSLTTPPYTETVRWVIMKKVLEASPAQIQRINELEGNNARHVQALFGRKIEQ
ncbi:MAG: carbonic anhydrase family protein [Bacteroidales bacterium]|nr:carbonic anhydrase family protein [Bacteroidales bacterium]